MTFAEGLAQLTAGYPADSLVDLIHNRIGGVADSLTDRRVTPAQRAEIVAILAKAQADVTQAIQKSRRPRPFGASS